IDRLRDDVDFSGIELHDGFRPWVARVCLRADRYNRSGCVSVALAVDPVVLFGLMAAVFHTPPSGRAPAGALLAALPRPCRRADSSPVWRSHAMPLELPGIDVSLLGHRRH